MTTETTETTETIRIDCPSKAHECTYYVDVTGCTRHRSARHACSL